MNNATHAPVVWLVNGNVTITGWERNEVQIDAVKKARDQQKLDDIEIAAFERKQGCGRKKR